MVLRSRSPSRSRRSCSRDSNEGASSARSKGPSRSRSPLVRKECFVAKLQNKDRNKEEQQRLKRERQQREAMLSKPEQPKLQQQEDTNSETGAVATEEAAKKRFPAAPWAKRKTTLPKDDKELSKPERQGLQVPQAKQCSSIRQLLNEWGTNEKTAEVKGDQEVQVRGGSVPSASSSGVPPTILLPTPSANQSLVGRMLDILDAQARLDHARNQLLLDSARSRAAARERMSSKVPLRSPVPKRRPKQ